MKLDLDQLEARAVEVIARTYDVRNGDMTERFWIQKGIEGMRCAIAETLQDSETLSANTDQASAAMGTDHPQPSPRDTSVDNPLPGRRDIDAYRPLRRPGKDDITMSADKHVALLIEVPVIYTDDLDDLREYRDEFETESDWLLDCIRVGGPVRLRVENEGEKDSEVIEVWGGIREASLVDPSRGYETGEPHLTDDQLREHGEHKLLRDERACDWCATNLQALRDAEDDD